MANGEDREGSESLALIGKGAVEAIPYIGPVISNLYFERRNRRHVQRLERLVVELRERMQDFGEEKVDHEFLQTDEFADIAEECIINSLKTATEAKLRTYREILIGSAMRGHPAYDEVKAAREPRLRWRKAEVVQR